MKIYIDPGYYTENRRAPADSFIDDEEGLVRGIGEELAEILRANGYDALVSSPVHGARSSPGRSNTAAARISEANAWQADYYIMLLLNSSRDPFTTGSDASICRRNSKAKPLAESILERLHLVTMLQNRGVNIRPDIYALGRADMPAVSVGMGYSTNEGDARMLTEHPEQFALGIANGVIALTQSGDRADERQDSGRVRFFQHYPEGRTGSCRLNVDVLAGNNKNGTPVSGAEVTVFEGAGGRRMLVYRGKTDHTGRIIPVELPLTHTFGEGYDIHPRMFCVCVRHPEYMPQNQWIDLLDQSSIDHSIILAERRGRAMS